MYEIAHLLRNRMPWIWRAVNVVNSALFSMRYGRRLRTVEAKVRRCGQLPSAGYAVVPLREMDAETMAAFFARQPESAYTYFTPHGFDVVTLRRLARNRSFLAYAIVDKANGHVAGYCFNRSFFHGKGFRGRMVDIDYRGRGLATMMNRLLDEVGFSIGLRLFETVSKDNVASYLSALAASRVRVVEELPHNELYLEIMKADDSAGH